MDEKEAEARPVMGTIFLVVIYLYTVCMQKNVSASASKSCITH